MVKGEHWKLCVCEPGPPVIDGHCTGCAKRADLTPDEETELVEAIAVWWVDEPRQYLKRVRGRLRPPSRRDLAA